MLLGARSGECLADADGFGDPDRQRLKADPHRPQLVQVVAERRYAGAVL